MSISTSKAADTFALVVLAVLCLGAVLLITGYMIGYDSGYKTGYCQAKYNGTVVDGHCQVKPAETRPIPDR